MSTGRTSPAFLVSLPRSGSTLLQRLLASHPDIATTAEPWLLPPHLYAVRDAGSFAEYNHASAQRGVREFLAGIPDGETTYRRELAAFLTAMYTHASANKPFFLDKTPRNSLVAGELLDLFPSGRVLLLWRDPIAVVSSIATTWGRGRWVVPRYTVDLVIGFRNMLDLLALDDPRVLSLTYEELVTHPGETLTAACSHLGLRHVEGLEDSLVDVQLAGSMGDPTGTRSYDRVSEEPLEKWRHARWSPVRKAWTRRWLRGLDADKLALAGYDRNVLLHALDCLPNDYLSVASDQFDVLRTTLPSYLEPAIWRRKLKILRDHGPVIAHR